VHQESHPISIPKGVSRTPVVGVAPGTIGWLR
jgi:hypothetical protein